jgi:hypothetical protein
MPGVSESERLTTYTVSFGVAFTPLPNISNSSRGDDDKNGGVPATGSTVAVDA